MTKKIGVPLLLYNPVTADNLSKNFPEHFTKIGLFPCIHYRSSFSYSSWQLPEPLPTSVCIFLLGYCSIQDAISSQGNFDNSYVFLKAFYFSLDCHISQHIFNLNMSSWINIFIKFVWYWLFTSSPNDILSTIDSCVFFLSLIGI